MTTETRATTADVYHAAFLALNGFRPRLEIQTYGRVLFCFDDAERFRTLTERFHSDEEVPAMSYATAARRLRGELLGLREQWTRERGQGGR